MSVAAKLHVGMSLAPTWLSGEAWRRADSDINGVFSSDYFVDLAQRAEAAHVDFVFRPDTLFLRTEGLETGGGFASMDPTMLLAAIAFVTLSVGGIGITNMMMVSVSERYREIGLRKALGATDREVRIQFLVESVIVCSLAGIIGIIIGFLGYHGAILASTQFMSTLKFEWTMNWFALSISILSIFLVGVLSGIFPALKAEKLQVIEALRSE